MFEKIILIGMETRRAVIMLIYVKRSYLKKKQKKTKKTKQKKNWRHIRLETAKSLVKCTHSNFYQSFQWEFMIDCEKE